MGTVETRLPEEGIGGLVSLKFWMCGSQIKDFSLSTIIYEPHRSGVSRIRSEIVIIEINNASYIVISLRALRSYYSEPL